jgi:hypothetical protein
LNLIEKTTLVTKKPAFQWLGLAGLDQFLNSTKDDEIHALPKKSSRKKIFDIIKVTKPSLEEAKQKEDESEKLNEKLRQQEMDHIEKLKELTKFKHFSELTHLSQLHKLKQQISNQQKEEENDASNLDTNFFNLNECSISKNPLPFLSLRAILNKNKNILVNKLQDSYTAHKQFLKQQSLTKWNSTCFEKASSTANTGESNNRDPNSLMPCLDNLSMLRSHSQSLLGVESRDSKDITEKDESGEYSPSLIRRHSSHPQLQHLYTTNNQHTTNTNKATSFSIPLSTNLYHTTIRTPQSFLPQSNLLTTLPSNTHKGTNIHNLHNAHSVHNVHDPELDCADGFLENNSLCNASLMQRQNYGEKEKENRKRAVRKTSSASYTCADFEYYGDAKRIDSKAKRNQIKHRYREIENINYANNTKFNILLEVANSASHSNSSSFRFPYKKPLAPAKNTRPFNFNIQSNQSNAMRCNKKPILKNPASQSLKLKGKKILDFDDLHTFDMDTHQSKRKKTFY